MSRFSRVVSGLPQPSRRAIERLGRDIAVARRRRRIPQRLMAERMLVSLQTLQRREAGDPTVGLAALAAALFVPGLTGRLETLVAPESDAVGTAEELARLPRSIRAPRADDSLDF